MRKKMIGVFAILMCVGCATAGVIYASAESERDYVLKREINNIDLQDGVDDKIKLYYSSDMEENSSDTYILSREIDDSYIEGEDISNFADFFVDSSKKNEVEDSKSNELQEEIIAKPTEKLIK